MRLSRATFLRCLGLGWFARRAAQPSTAAPAEHLPIRIGILTDCQYADCDTPPNSKRLYRLSPKKLQEAVDHLNNMDDLDFAIHLGDMIDRDFGSYAVVMPIFEKLQAPRHQVLGNHDYTVADKEKFGVPGALKMSRRYYSWVLRGWRFLVLDGNEVSTFAHPAGSPEQQSAAAYQKSSKRKLADYNGGLGAEQVAWLKAELQAAKLGGEKVIAFCHYPLLPVDAHALWNAEEIMDVLRGFPGVVAAWLNGHNHDGNYAARHGIHCLNFRGMVDTPLNSYARVEIHPDCIYVTGFGREPTRVLTLPARDAAAESERATKPKPKAPPSPPDGQATKK